MAVTYYAVCDANGPISVELEGETQDEAIAAFRALDARKAIDDARTDIEDALGIDGANMSEAEFAAALETAGATVCHGPLYAAHPVWGAAGYGALLSDGWALWAVAS